MILSARPGILSHRMDDTPALVHAALAGEEAAYDALVAGWGPTILRWCARLGGPRVDAEEAAADVVERLFLRLPTLRDPAAFPAWIFRTTRGVIAHHRRRAWLRRWIPGLVPDVEDPAVGPGRRYELSETARVVQAILETLPLELREVLVLCDVDERSGTEVAMLLAIPLGTVKSRLRRARTVFRAEAARRGLEPGEERG